MGLNGGSGPLDQPEHEDVLHGPSPGFSPLETISTPPTAASDLQPQVVAMAGRCSSLAT
jgi:hypothetical protein